MGLSDIFKIKQYKNDLEVLQQEYEALKSLMTPEMQDALALKNEILKLENEQLIEQNKITDLDKKIVSKNQEISTLDKSIKEKKEKIICLNDEVLVQEFGLYEPQYAFSSALDYQEALVQIRSTQKYLIKQKLAVNGNANWQVNGNATKGKKMISDTQKLILRAFNSECDDLISKVKYTNFEASLNKIYKSSEAISNLGTVMDIFITTEYLDSKVKELRLSFEYQQKKQLEKEEQRAARAEIKEAAKLQREIEEERRKFVKEQTHYQTALDRLLLQLDAHPDNADLLCKKNELEKQLTDIDIALKDIDYREANKRAGYVYIISNIGAFGENVYKIGMTRRLEPQERVDELGDASVPFNFDVHAMIFSNDAPALETALHKAFENRKLNMVNLRREFFKVTLDEIKDVIQKNFDKTVEFTDVPNAEQFRVSQKMKLATVAASQQC